MTNNHVVDGAKTVQVTTDDGRTLDAKVVGADPKTDVALLKVTEGGNFPFVKLAKAAPRVGDWVVAIGNPFGLGGTVTARHRLGARPRHRRRARMTTSCRSTPRSTRATPAARPSTSRARSSA